MKSTSQLTEPKTAEAVSVARVLRPVTGFGFEHLFAMSQNDGEGGLVVQVNKVESVAPDADLADSTDADDAEWSTEIAALHWFTPGSLEHFPLNLEAEKIDRYQEVHSLEAGMIFSELPVSLPIGEQAHPDETSTGSVRSLPVQVAPLDVEMAIADVTGNVSPLISDLKGVPVHGQALSFELPKNAPTTVLKEMTGFAPAINADFVDFDESSSLALIGPDKTNLSKVALPDFNRPAFTADGLLDDVQIVARPETKPQVTAGCSISDTMPRRAAANVLESKGAPVLVRGTPILPVLNPPMVAEQVDKQAPILRLPDFATLDPSQSGGSVRIATKPVRDDQVFGKDDIETPDKIWRKTSIAFIDQTVNDSAQHVGSNLISRTSPAFSASPQATATPPPHTATLNLRKVDWGKQLISRIEQMVIAGSQRIELSLRPKNLGEIHVVLDFSGDQTMVHLITETAAAARLLSGAEDRLSQLLDQSGFRLSGFSAQEHGTGSQAGQQGQHHQSARQSTRLGVRAAKRDDASEAAEKSAYSSSRRTTSGINMLA